MAARSLARQVGIAPACRALGVSRSTFYRRARPAPGRRQPRPTPARALSQIERKRVEATLASPRFVDRSPGEVVATLLDEGRYLCSERTMYRILEANHPVRDRRNQRVHPSYAKPELVAVAPNQVWSWDITRLLGPQTWTYYYLYVLLDLFSRYAVGWMVADRENSALAQRLIEETCLKHGVKPHVLTLHSDRGAPMTSQGTAQLLARLGVNPVPGPPAGQRRQPLLRSTVQDPQVPPRLPQPLPQPGRRDRLLQVLLPLVQHGTPPCRHRHADPRDRPLRPGASRDRAAPTHAERRLGKLTRTIRRRPTDAHATAPGRLDQQAQQRDCRNDSVNPEPRCVNVVDRFRRRVDTAGREWPEVNADEWKARLRLLRLGLVNELVPLTPFLGKKPPKGDLPDSFGFAYATLCHEAITALEDVDATTFGRVYTVLVPSALRAHERVRSELAERPAEDMLYFAAEVMLDVIEISGYAYVWKFALGESEFWDSLTGDWHEFLSKHPNPASLIQLIVLEEALHKSTFAISPRSGLRWEWKRRLRLKLEERGFAPQVLSPSGTPRVIPIDPIVSSHLRTVGHERRPRLDAL